MGIQERSETEFLRWAEEETYRRLREEDRNREAEIDPIANFPPEGGWFRDGDGPQRSPDEPCKALAAVIHGSCNGWPAKPTALEAERALKERRRGNRADAIAWTIATESSDILVIEAEMDNGYSLQDLAWWIRELKIPAYRRINWLNTMSRAWTATHEKAET